MVVCCVPGFIFSSWIKTSGCRWFDTNDEEDDAAWFRLLLVLPLLPLVVVPLSFLLFSQTIIPMGCFGVGGWWWWWMISVVLNAAVFNTWFVVGFTTTTVVVEDGRGRVVDGCNNKVVVESLLFWFCCCCRDRRRTLSTFVVLIVMGCCGSGMVSCCTTLLGRSEVVMVEHGAATAAATLIRDVWRNTWCIMDTGGSGDGGNEPQDECFRERWRFHHNETTTWFGVRMLWLPVVVVVLDDVMDSSSLETLCVSSCRLAISSGSSSVWHWVESSTECDDNVPPVVLVLVVVVAAEVVVE